MPVFRKIKWEAASDRDRSNGYILIEAEYEGKKYVLKYESGNEQRVFDPDSGLFEVRVDGAPVESDEAEDVFLDVFDRWEDVTEAQVQEAFMAFLAELRS